MSMRMIGRLALLAAAVAGAALLSGCWDRTEINDLGLITGAAIDRHDDKSIELAVQIFIPRASSGGGGSMEMGQKSSTGSSSTFVHSAVGENIADALSHLQERLPRKLFWGHAEVIIFGESEARHGIRDDVDYLMRAPQPRERAYIYVSAGKARRVLEMQAVLERDSSEALREIAKSKLSMSVTMTELAKMLSDETGAAALPWIKQNQPRTKSNPDTTANYKNGTAIFKQDRMIGVVDEETTRGLLWLRNEVKSAVLTVTPAGADGTVSAKVLRSTTKLKPHIEHGKWSMTVRLHAETDALQNASSANLMTSQAAVRSVEKAIDKNMTDRVNLALRAVQKGLKADAFDFAGEFHRAYPKTWHRYASQWDDIFPEVEVKVISNSRLLRPGLSNVQTSEKEREGRQ
ncbi:Ger(x)C family spore germination protein [Paenibacillus sacheonensis]|uniref:Ger(X)C family spore germination protein n=1 Tax=Paenibacillus sacheonensis TaxID=742054 RepID=A0A7X4YS86_9BACL|nr:Ger(x)C family spore germination protein [Paenibacillus sacheonensis]MBM7566963.1 spore germination protein KC [Paenibacillus sacheonensis]NBC71585.1 Ger(x)C family spore germination protein [Paenibacillus sacheonensis]